MLYPSGLGFASKRITSPLRGSRGVRHTIDQDAARDARSENRAFRTPLPYAQENVPGERSYQGGVIEEAHVRWMEAADSALQVVAVEEDCGTLIVHVGEVKQCRRTGGWEVARDPLR